MRNPFVPPNTEHQHKVGEIEQDRLRAVFRMIEDRLSWLAAKSPKQKALSLEVSERLSYLAGGRERFVTESEMIAYGQYLREQSILQGVVQKDGVVTYLFSAPAHEWFRERKVGPKAKPAPQPKPKQKPKQAAKATPVQPPKPTAPPAPKNRKQAIESARKLIAERPVPAETHINLPPAATLCWPVLLSVAVRPAKFASVLNDVATAIAFNRRFLTIPVPISTNKSLSLLTQAACEYLVRTGFLKREAKSKLLRTTEQGDNLVIAGIPPSQWPGFTEPRIKGRFTRMVDQPMTTQRAYLSLNMNAEKVVKSLSKLDRDKILAIWHNASRILADRTRQDEHPRASQVLEALRLEFDRRSEPGKPDEYFSWPTTEAQSGDGTLDSIKAQPEGLLATLGYHVGRTHGLLSSARQRILSRIFETSLPPVFEQAYMHEWGTNGSAVRLQKMAESIAAFTRNTKRREDDRLDDAIQQWEQDLQFLYDRYYVGKFRFAWPVTTI